MDNVRRFRVSGQSIVGLGAIVFGALILLDNMGVLDAGIYLQFWPVILIALGLVRLLQFQRSGGRFWGLALIVIGAALLLRSLHVSNVGMEDLWPLLLILIGFSLMSGTGHRWRHSLQDAPDTPSSPDLSCFAVLSGTKRTMTSRNFQSGEITAVMGGCEVDLRSADIDGKEAVITTFAMWGGIKIQVPREWSVDLQGFPLLGGFDDKTQQPADSGAKKLIVRGSAIMGGVEITN